MRKIIESERQHSVVWLGVMTTVAIVVAALAIAANASAEPQPQTAKTPARAAGGAATAGMARSPNELVVSYLAAWNERDAKRRRELIAKTWTESGSYVDEHRRGDNHDGIDAMIKAVQDKLGGAAYAFRLHSGIDAHNGYVRFTWAAGGMSGAPLYFEGTDIFLIAPDGRVQQVIGFTNAAPASR